MPSLGLADTVTGRALDQHQRERFVLLIGVGVGVVPPPAAPSRGTITVTPSGMFLKVIRKLSFRHDRVLLVAFLDRDLGRGVFAVVALGAFRQPSPIRIQAVHDARDLHRSCRPRAPVDLHGRRDLAAVADTRSVRPQARDLQLEAVVTFVSTRGSAAATGASWNAVHFVWMPSVVSSSAVHDELPGHRPQVVGDGATREVFIKFVARCRLCATVERQGCQHHHAVAVAQPSSPSRRSSVRRRRLHSRSCRLCHGRW